MVLFLKLAELAETLAATASRLKKRALIADAIRSAHADDAISAGLFALYLAGQPFAEADPRKLNAGGAMVSRIVAGIGNATDAAMTTAFRRHGDLGATAQDIFADAGHAPQSTLTLTELQQTFAHAAVAKTTAIRQALITATLQRATPVEAKYLIKLMLGDMRIGVKQSLIEDAIAVAAEAPVTAVRNVVMLQADLAQATEMAFAQTLQTAKMRLFHPLGFMLASPVETPDEAVERFSKSRAADASTPPETNVEPDPPRVSDEAYRVTEQEEVAVESIHIQAQIEDKYDGMRVQLHCSADEGRVALYSRNREDVTESYPEIAEAFAHVSKTQLGDLILDGELLAWDVAQQRALPFAVLSPRIGRKKVSNEVRTKTPVVFMAFDVLYAGGELLLELPLRERRNRLEAIAEQLVPFAVSPLALAAAADAGLFAHQNSGEGSVERFLLSPVSLAYSAEDLDRAYNAARERGNEGVMIKAAESAYQPGRRGLSWVKLKRQLGTLDVVITGAEFGSGKRSQVLSDYTFAIRGPAGDLLNVGKAYSGVTDAEIAELTAWLKDHTLEDHGHFRTVEPGIILEVAFNNVMRSERHASGFALRFPRIVRLRTDKPLEEIDTLERVEEIYQSQPDKPVE